MTLKSLLILFVATVQILSLEAYQPYRAKVKVDAFAAHFKAPNMVDLNRELKTSSIQEEIPFYTENSAVSINYNLRGLRADLSFGANSTLLVVNIPNSGITETFHGSTREESLALFKDFVKEGSSIKKLLKGYTRFSPIDPIAGNPRCLIAAMASADYLLGHLSPLSGCDCSYESQPIVHQFQAGLEVSRAFAKKFDTTTVAIPMRYSYSPDLKGAIIIDAPLEYIRNGGASSMFLSLGLAYRMPITNEWSLTSIVRMGSGGSLDLCTAGNFFGVGGVSVYNLKLSDYLFSLTNYAGYLVSTNLWLTGVNFNYHLKSPVFKNGLSVATCPGIAFCGKTFHLKAEIRDTYFSNSRLFIKHYDEVAFSVITYGINPCLVYDCLSTEIAFQWGQKGYKGYQLNIIYQF